MIIYWSMIAFTALLALIDHQSSYGYITDSGVFYKKTRRGIAILWAGYLLFWIGLRSGVGDTPAYIFGFREIPMGWNLIGDYIASAGKGKGFQFIAFVFKNTLSQNYHAWLFFVALISMYCVTKVFYQKSEDFTFSAYLFITSCLFTWLINGIRQFLACTILFLFSDWFVNNKRFKYIILILLASLIHNTALIMIPIVLFFKDKEPWGKRTFVFIILFSIGIAFSDQLLGIFTQTEIGSAYAEGLANSEGTNIIRTLVAAVPCVLAFIERDTLHTEGSAFIKTAVIMSLVCLCFYILSSFTSGVLLGRLPNYFEIYNMILIPWLIEHSKKLNSARMLKVSCIVLYLIFFVYQMTVTWNLYYISDFTGRIL